MKWPYQCDKCGASLDAGEHCDCESSQHDERRQQEHGKEAHAEQIGHLPLMRERLADQRSGRDTTRGLYLPRVRNITEEGAIT